MAENEENKSDHSVASQNDSEVQFVTADKNSQEDENDR